MDAQQDLRWLPLTQWFGGERFAPVEDQMSPKTTWGLFEVIQADGTLNWTERSSRAYNAEAILAQLSGFLGDLERSGSATAGDPESAADVEWADEAPDDESWLVPLDERFAALEFVALEPTDRLTGRYVFLVLGGRGEDEHESDVIQVHPGLDGPELEGLLRLAQARFTESLAWAADEEEDLEEDDESGPGSAAGGTLGALFPGWTFATLPEAWEITWAWVAIEIQRPGGYTCWVERAVGPVDGPRLLSTAVRAVAGLEATLVDSWDRPEERPAGAQLPPRGSASPEEALQHEGPLDHRLAALDCEPLPAGWRPLRALLVAPGRDEAGANASAWAYSARPGEAIPAPYIDDYTELGLLRGLVRDLTRAPRL